MNGLLPHHLRCTTTIFGIIQTCPMSRVPGGIFFIKSSFLHLSIRVAEALCWIHHISYHLLDLFDLRKSIVFFSVKNFFIVDRYFIGPTYFTWLKGYLFDVIVERCENFLCHVGCAQQPAALGTVLNGDRWLHCKSFDKG